MSVFIPPDGFIIYETEHWRVNQRCDATLPGYLMVAAKDPEAVALHSLSHGALTEMGVVLGAVVSALETCFHPQHVFVCRFGLDAGHTVHFHVIPIYPWVVAAYERKSGSLEADGPMLTLFVSEELTHGRCPCQDIGLTVQEAISTLRKALDPSLVKAHNTL